MDKPRRAYQRLTRPASGMASYQSLWLGNDHLLLLSSTGYAEEYRRIRLRDIQGILIVASHRRVWWALPWGIIGVIFLTIVWFGLSAGESVWGSAFMVGLMVIFLVWNHLLGPGCDAYVVTGVQTAPLPALVRKPRAEKILARLRPLIEAAQAGIGADMGTETSRIPPPLP